MCGCWLCAKQEPGGAHSQQRDGVLPDLGLFCQIWKCVAEELGLWEM